MDTELPLTQELAVVAARMSGLLLSRETVESVLDLIVSLAAEANPAALGAGVSLMDEQGRRTTAAATDQLVRKADALQYDLGQGPCLTAWHRREVVRVEDLDEERQWKEWSGAVSRLGVRACLSAPLLAGDDCLGAVKIYAREPQAFRVRDEQLLTEFAGQAAVLVANVRTAERADRSSALFRRTLRDRDVVNMAKGLLMGREAIDEETAFGRLIALAATQRVKPVEVAEALLRPASRGEQ